MLTSLAPEAQAHYSVSARSTSVVGRSEEHFGRGKICKYTHM